MTQQISLISEKRVSNSGSPNSQRREVKTGLFLRSSQIPTICSVVPISFEYKATKLICHLIIFIYRVSRISGRCSLFFVWYHQGRHLYWRRNVVSGIIHGFLIYSTERWCSKLNTPRLHSSTYLQRHHSHIHSAVTGSTSYGVDKLYYPTWQSIALMSDSF